MKRIVLIVLSIFFVVQAGFGESKVAVLDASLGEDVHHNASAIVADTINEQFVKSSGYIAIDRTYISSIQAEKQFQLSGEVDDSDIKELGVTFGADYLCIANVSLLGSTYTVSARLIEVSSAEVVAQESHRMQGQIDVLFNIAEVVGSKFVGDSQAEEVVASMPEKPKPEPVAVSPVPNREPAPEKWEPKGRVSVSYMIPFYIGDKGNDTYSGDDFYSFYEQDEYFEDLGLDSYNTNWGVDLHMLVPLDFFYIGFDVCYCSQYNSVEYYDSETFNDSIDTYEIFSLLDVSVGAGIILSPFSNLQIYAGGSVGYMLFTLGSEYSDDATGSYWAEPDETAMGLTFGGDAGADFFLGNICVSMRYTLIRAADLTGDYIFTDEYEEDLSGDTSFGAHGFTIGVGFSI